MGRDSHQKTEASKSVGNAVPGGDTARFWSHHGVHAQEDTPPQDEGHDSSWRSKPCARPQAATAPTILCLRNRICQSVRAYASQHQPIAPAKRTSRLRQLRAINDFSGAKRFEISASFGVRCVGRCICPSNFLFVKSVVPLRPPLHKTFLKGPAMSDSKPFLISRTQTEDRQKRASPLIGQRCQRPT
jgi:hypothetical protein